jgi:hypothetical protein
MLEAGYPAIRFTEAIENYNREHQDARVVDGAHCGDTADGIDFPYLANYAGIICRDVIHAQGVSRCRARAFQGLMLNTAP